MRRLHLKINEILVERYTRHIHDIEIIYAIKFMLPFKMQSASEITECGCNKIEIEKQTKHPVE